MVTKEEIQAVLSGTGRIIELWERINKALSKVFNRLGEKTFAELVDHSISSAFKAAMQREGKARFVKTVCETVGMQADEANSMRQEAELEVLSPLKVGMDRLFADTGKALRDAMTDGERAELTECNEKVLELYKLFGDINERCRVEGLQLENGDILTPENIVKLAAERDAEREQARNDEKATTEAPAGEPVPA
jgi:hypothetical protein